MADVELNSIGNGDGTNYLVRDNTKIPLSGTNALAGSIVPSTDNTYDLGSSSKRFTNVYAYNFPSFMRAMSPSDTTDIFLIAGTDTYYGAYLQLSPKDTTSSVAGSFRLVARDSSNQADLIGTPSGTLTWAGKNVAMQEDTVPRSGGAVLSGTQFCRTINDSYLAFSGGNSWQSGGCIAMYGSDAASSAGGVQLVPAYSISNYKNMKLLPDGTWTWTGTAVQLVSDQRYKQQISEIDNALLDAWEDVELSQFKYNDAVEQKGKDKARLHTGYVVQQIDEACKSHGVDISKYGLYCHEEYAEETREVEQADGTKTTEVVRPASEHYSLRYTEALIVECAYLRKKNKDLQEQLNALSERLEKLENR